MTPTTISSIRPATPPPGITALINATNRARRCRRKLRRDAALGRSAQAYAEAMHRSGNFTHGDWVARLHAHGVTQPGGENIAHGQSSMAEVLSDWLASPEHRRNINDCGFRRIGVGHAGTYWVQDFGY